MASKKIKEVTFNVTPSAAKKVERIQNWDQRHLKYGDVNHFGRIAFEELLNKEYAAYEAAKEEEKRRKEKERQKK